MNDCDHKWHFLRTGVDRDVWSGKGPQRANYRCSICGDIQRFPIGRDVDKPDTTQPYYATPLRAQWSIDQARADNAALLD